MVMAIGRQHMMKFSMKIWNQIEFLKMKEDPVKEQNRDDKLNERRMFCDPSRLGYMRKPEGETLELRSFLGGNDQKPGKAG
jgi:hypothetical protein